MKLDSHMAMHAGIRFAQRATVILAVWLGTVSGAVADDFAGLSDPTQPAYGSANVGPATKAGPSNPLLQSTFISASQRRAVIGGRSYGVGDKFGAGTIADIQPYEVVLKTAGGESRLRLLPKLAKETYVVKVPTDEREGGDDR